MRPGAVWAAAALAAPALLAGTPAFLDGPPPAHTGGFGEPTCGACHFDVPTPDPAGGIVVEGLPDAYAPGATYPLTVRLHRPSLARGGFELSARYAHGDAAAGQAGSLSAEGPGTAVTAEGGIQYAHNTRAGAEPDSAGRVAWPLRWTAPAEPSHAVVFHLAGVAGDGDESQFGDHVYAGSSEVGGRSTPSVGSR